jgi:hypothetical protein
MRSSTRYPTTTTARHRRRHLTVLAAERTDRYDPAAVEPAAPTEADEPVEATESSSEAPGAGSAGTDGAPFGLPVLAELPRLAGTLQRLADADGAMLDAIAGLAGLLDDDTVAHTCGVGLEHWIGIVTRHTRMDRRFLLRVARQLTRYPALRHAVEVRAISWPQLRGLSLALREVPPELRERVDGLLGRLVAHLDPDADPDAIIDQLKHTLTRWKAQLAPEPVEVPSGNRLTLQPNLEGTGGHGYLDLDAVGLALIDEATHPRADQLQHPGGLAAARADNLLTRVTHTCDGTLDTPHDDEADPSDDVDGVRGAAGEGDQSAATAPVAGNGAADPNAAGDRKGEAGWFGQLAPPKLLLRAELADLLDADRLPAELLHRLVGGTVRLTTDAARRLVDTRGVELRAVILDEGTVVGVGRATRRPPGWLTDAIAELHSTCTGPLCDRPARGAQLDHAIPWTPTGPHEVPGTTDVDNVGPLCGDTNRGKEAAGWRATQTADGRRRWHHPRTGLTTTSIPTAWRPPDPPHRPPGTDPPDQPPGDRTPDPDPG